MYTKNRWLGLAVVVVSLAGLTLGCQSPDDAILTEAERTIGSAALSADEIIVLIEELIGDPTIERSTKSQFNNVVKAKTEGEKIAKAKSLIDYITKHFAAGKWVDEGGVKTGELILAIGQFAGLFPPSEDGGAATCLPGNECVVTTTSEEGEITIPSTQVTQTFTVIMTLTDCTFSENAVPPCYEITTIPEGITFDSSPSTSLSLSSSHLPFVALCSAFSEAYEVGSEVFLWHAHDGVVEPLETVPDAICDDEVAELSSPWANQLLATFRPVLEILGPQPLYAAGGLGTGLGGAISSFSEVGSCLPGCFPTTTEVSLEGGPSFNLGDPITLRAVVDPEPFNDENPKVVFRVEPLSGGFAPTEPVVDGVAEHQFICGDAHVPAGSHTAGAAFLGTPGHSASLSGQVLSFTCGS